MIEIKDLKKAFEGVQVLKGVNLTIKDRELMVIIGRSGAGKSVLLKHLIGLYRPDSGSILIDGEDIIKSCGKKEVCSIRERFGVLFQGGALFDSMTVFENVAFPLQEKTRLSREVIAEKVREALEDVGLSGIEDKYPAELSGGMRKRVALARALITEPEIVLFDEPTTGLDPISMNSIHQLIIRTHKKYRFTGVVISHDIPHVFDIADRVAMIHDGQIVEVGLPEEIIGSENPVVRQFIRGELEGPIKVLH
ncbi:MAG: ABC transporter ATP-binding protein [Nitrospirae bacterium]|nr:MAG: ABC transporter ATP-binding protein [Nitrospirota bacterium]